ncbi:hypothetical protein FACS1894110_25510 [Spirochaetia bacterium]|nr:hypothetical protein FACS1894110_25510 [Spirochaetia bacterium]
MGERFVGFLGAIKKGVPPKPNVVSGPPAFPLLNISQLAGSIEKQAACYKKSYR